MEASIFEMVATEIIGSSPDGEKHICYDEIRPSPRVKREASDIYTKNQGTVKLFIFNDHPDSSRVYSYDEIKPVPRVKGEAAENFQKNKGSIQDSVFKNEQCCIQTQKDKKRIPTPRCPTRESKENYNLHRNGSIKFEEMYTDVPQRPKTTPSPRVRPEASNIARLSSGGRMRSIVNEFGQHRPSHTTQRVKSEGQGVSNLSRGGRMNLIFTKYGQVNDNKAVPRVKGPAKSNAEMGKGQRMSEILSSRKSEQLDYQTTPRVKKEAVKNATIGKGTRMQKILTSVEPDDPRPSPRVKKEAQNMANLDKGNRLSTILRDANSLPDSPKLTRGVRSAEAKRIQDYGRGHVGQTLTGEDKHDYIVFKPGLHSPHYDIAPAY